MTNLSIDALNALGGERPLQVWRKAIIGGVNVKLFNSTTRTETQRTLRGDRQQTENSAPDTIVNLWTAEEVRYFVNANRGHIDRQNIIRLTDAEIAAPATSEITDVNPNKMSLDEIKEACRANRWASMQKYAREIDDKSQLKLFINVLEEMGKSDKVRNLFIDKLNSL
jgi:hypothetical protein